MDTLGSLAVFSWAMAEELAVAHLEALGFLDVRRTRSGRDGGLDAVGSSVVAQVKNLARPVGSPEVQQLRGAAHGVENAVFYSRSGYTSSALEYAETVQVALFAFTDANTVTPVNQHGAALADRARPTREFSELVPLLGAGIARYEAWCKTIQGISEALEAAQDRGVRDPDQFDRAADGFSSISPSLRAVLADIGGLADEGAALFRTSYSGSTSVDLQVLVRANVITETVVRIVERAITDLVEHLRKYGADLEIPESVWAPLLTAP